MSPFSFLPGRSGTCAAALLITTSLLLGGCKAGEGRPRRPRKEGGGCRAGGNRQGRAPCGSRQLHRHRCAGAARRGASGGQDLGRCAVGDGGRRPEGVGGPGAGAPGSGSRASGGGAERSAAAQAGKQLSPRHAVGGAAVGQRRRCGPAQIRCRKQPCAAPACSVGALLHHGAGANLRRDRIALDQDRQLRADQHADLPHRRRFAARGHAQRARTRTGHAQVGPAGDLAGRCAAWPAIRRQGGPHRAGGGFRQWHVSCGLRVRPGPKRCSRACSGASASITTNARTHW